MSAILMWFLLLFGAEVLVPAGSATAPTDTTMTPTVTILDDGSGIPPRTQP